ncbi:fibrobacter succinogenes major paralogous domain-containing protein [Bacteroidales bacterium]|nr:fibrobacter succinogenes major paralogous domain-containing protein [Bacteroidales bacterium]
MNNKLILFSLSFIMLLFACEKLSEVNETTREYDFDNTSITGDSGTVEDIEGNKYKIVKIGEQWWMAENLKVTKYPDGKDIPHVKDSTIWSNLSDDISGDAYCWYSNEENSQYGMLYTWAATMGKQDVEERYLLESQGVCPDGWHVPGYYDWDTLENYLIKNGFNYDDSKYEDKIAKSLASTYGWESSNYSGAIGNEPEKNNATDFTATPTYYRNNTGNFEDKDNAVYYWTSSGHVDNAACRYMTNNSYRFYSYSRPKRFGLAVRCIKD